MSDKCIPYPEPIVDKDDLIKKFAQAWLLKACEMCHNKREAELFLADCLTVLNNLRANIVPDLFYGGCIYDKIVHFPVGFVQMYIGITPPSGWLLCDGSALDVQKYPKLSALLVEAGLSGDKVPDFRECALVGAGENGTDVIANHDVYSVGEFKDDQFAAHTHPVNDPGHSHHIPVNFTNEEGGGNNNVASGSDYEYTGELIAETTGTNISVGSSGNGATTHGKRKGINYIIKCDGN